MFPDTDFGDHKKLEVIVGCRNDGGSGLNVTNDSSVAYFQIGKLLIFKTTTAAAAVHSLNPIESDTNKAGRRIFLPTFGCRSIFAFSLKKYLHLRFPICP